MYFGNLRDLRGSEGERVDCMGTECRRDGTGMFCSALDPLGQSGKSGEVSPPLAEIMGEGSLCSAESTGTLTALGTLKGLLGGLKVLETGPVGFGTGGDAGGRVESGLMSSVSPKVKNIARQIFFNIIYIHGNAMAGEEAGCGIL